MASPYLPVETCLKVEADDSLDKKEHGTAYSTSNLFASAGSNLWTNETAEPESFNPLLLQSLKSEAPSPQGSSISPKSDDRSNGRNWPDCQVKNKICTKKVKQESFYQSQERVKQRIIMRMKRQDPGFRAQEREKGRHRMRMKRLDPLFRSVEREQQRSRMKTKRSDPEFREREREQQKNRLHIKRLDPEYREKERAQDRLRMRAKRETSVVKRDETIDDDSMVNDDCSNHSIHSFSQNQYSEPSEMLSQESNPKPLDRSHSKKSNESTDCKKQCYNNFNFYNSKVQWSLSDNLSLKDLPNFSPFNQVKTSYQSFRYQNEIQERKTLSKVSLCKNSPKLTEHEQQPNLDNLPDPENLSIQIMKSPKKEIE